QPPYYFRLKENSLYLLRTVVRLLGNDIHQSFLKSNDEMVVNLTGGTPVGDKIRRWVHENGCHFAEQPQLSIAITLHSGDQNKLLELAQLFENIVIRGRRDPVPGHKYICSRTAIALMRLAGALSRVWR